MRVSAIVVSQYKRKRLSSARLDVSPTIGTSAKVRILCDGRRRRQSPRRGCGGFVAFTCSQSPIGRAIFLDRALLEDLAPLGGDPPVPRIGVARMQHFAELAPPRNRVLSRRARVLGEIIDGEIRR